MRISIWFATACAILLATPHPGWGQNVRGTPLGAIQANKWEEAQALAARYADPVTEKLVLYYRLLAPGAATAPEIADFMRANPDWPAQALLERRRQDAIALEPQDVTVLAQCAATRPSQPAALLRCAEALAIAGRNPEAKDTARDAWVGAIVEPDMEASFQRRWNGVASAEDQWIRFDRLIWRDTVAAARQVGRLEGARRAAAEARLALRRDDQAASAMVAGLSSARQNDPGMVYDRLRYLRRTDRTAEAGALWREAGDDAQRALPNQRTEFWAERNLIARKLLKDGDKATAYAVVAAHGQTASEALTDAEFLAGFIALRQLNDPALARRHFATLAAVSKAAITQGRAHYWLGRADAAAGLDPKPAWEIAAGWPTTFYGQLAALALGDDGAALSARIEALRDPEWTRDTASAFTAHEVMRAAAWLVAWGDAKRARPFLLRMDELTPIPAERTLTALFALKVGLPDTAVFVARRVGRDGGALPQAGWPTPFEPPGPLDPAVALAIMRQESSFDIGAISSSGARGLMQLMPFTAQEVAKRLGVPTSLNALTSDPAHNMRLGTRYLIEVLDRFGGSLPLAAAGYNAGPHRVTQWLTDYGDPRGGQIDMIDWMELIPFNETRNYVQRVLENVAIYRARRGDSMLVAHWTR